MSPHILGACIALVHLLQSMSDELDALTGGNEWMTTMRPSVLALLENSEFDGFSLGEEQGIREAAQKAIAIVLSGRPVSDLLSEMTRH
jgi:hypothetical protein